MDAGALFAVHVPVLELVIRGTAVYWFLFLVFRFIIRRDIGALGIADVLLLVILADAAQNAMAGEYSTISAMAGIRFATSRIAISGGERSDPGCAPLVRTQVLKATVAMRTAATPRVANRDTRPAARFRASQLEKSFLFNCDSAAGASTRLA